MTAAASDAMSARFDQYAQSLPRSFGRDLAIVQSGAQADWFGPVWTNFCVHRK
jgi:hypothetical protein